MGLASENEKIICLWNKNDIKSHIKIIGQSIIKISSVVIKLEFSALFQLCKSWKNNIVNTHKIIPNKKVGNNAISNIVLNLFDQIDDWSHWYITECLMLNA